MSIYTMLDDVPFVWSDGCQVLEFPTEGGHHLLDSNFVIGSVLSQQHGYSEHTVARLWLLQLNLFKNTEGTMFC